MANVDVVEQKVVGAVLKLVMAVQAGDEGKRGLEYWIDECLVRGAKAVLRSREHAEAARNQRFFTEALAKDPTIISDPERLQKLMAQHKIGASK